MQKLSPGASMEPPRADFDVLVEFSQGRQIKMTPFPALQKVTRKIANMQTLHDENNGGVLLIVEARKQGVAAPFDMTSPSLFGLRIGRLERVVDDDEIATTAGKRASDRGRQPKAPLGGHDFRLIVLRRIDLGCRKHSPIPRRRQYRATIPGVLDCKLLGIAHA